MRGTTMKTHSCSFFMRLMVILIPILLLSGCFTRTKPYYMVEQYTLEYNPPVIQGTTALDELMKVERFSVAQSFNSTAMVYKPDLFKLAIYNYSRWRVNPGDLVTDYLLRDLRNSGIFRAVFSYRDAETTRFILKGGIEEFLELDEQNSAKAMLSISVALLDLSEKEITRKVLFQKGYRFSEPLKERTAEGLARGMSNAMAQFSEQLVKDINSAVKNRVTRRVEKN